MQGASSNKKKAFDPKRRATLFDPISSKDMKSKDKRPTEKPSSKTAVAQPKPEHRDNFLAHFLEGAEAAIDR